MFKAVTDVYGYIYIYRYEYECLCSKENVKDLPVLPSFTHYEYHFCFQATYLTLSNMFQ